MSQYTVQTMPDLKGQGHTVKYPRMLIRERICLRTLAEHIEQSSSFTVADVEGVMAAVSRQLSRLAAQGCSVKIDGLGTFCPTLGWRKGVERESAVGEYACIGRLSRSSASRELKRFLGQGLLSTRGRAPHRYYILPPAAEERNP